MKTLKEMRAIALGATQGSWIMLKRKDRLATDFQVCTFFDDHQVYTDRVKLNLGDEPKNAKHIATFDPPQVLALLDKIERYEKALNEMVKQDKANGWDNNLAREALKEGSDETR